MNFCSKNISINASELDRLRSFIQAALTQVKNGGISHDEFVEAIESCFEDDSVLTWTDCLIIRAIFPKSEAKVVESPQISKINPKDIMSDYDILTKWLNYNHDEAQEIIARNKIQRLEELKLQVLAQNPILLSESIADLDK